MGARSTVQMFYEEGNAFNSDTHTIRLSEKKSVFLVTVLTGGSMRAQRAPGLFLSLC